MYSAAQHVRSQSCTGISAGVRPCVTVSAMCDDVVRSVRWRVLMPLTSPGWKRCVMECVYRRIYCSKLNRVCC
jgi:hypothetical protein